MVSRRWKLPGRLDGIEGSLASEVPCSPLLARLLAGRGITDAAGAARFLDPKLAHLHDPFELPDMEKAVDRIERAVQQGEKIAVFGDYDADGVSSTCLVYDFFRFLGYPVQYRLPHRLLEGYGIRCDAVRELAAAGVRLIITVDNGSSSLEEVALARSLGVDVVVTDHHHPPPELPAAVAIVNPLAPGSRYPFKGLAGVGVAFKLVWALSQRFSRQKKLSPEFKSFLLESLALVALGTISDVVPLLGENRVLARFGLLALEKSRRPGLRRLVDAVLGAGEGEHLEASHIGFRLGPRINAAGRLGRAETAIDLLLAREDGQARDLAEALEGANKRRQEIEREMFDSARGLVLKDVDLASARAIVLGSEGWHAGVIGIVAARLADEFQRPTLLLSFEGARARGSARSIPGVHICDALASCREYLVGYGGHEMAAGVEMDRGLLEKLRHALNGAIPLAPGQMLPEVEFDGEIRLSELTAESLHELTLLKPHGHGNPQPLFSAAGLEVVGSPRVVGEGGRHLSFHVRQDGAVFKAIAFRQGEWLLPVARPGARVSLLFEPGISRWQGRSSIELNVREIREG